MRVKGYGGDYIWARLHGGSIIVEEGAEMIVTHDD